MNNLEYMIGLYATLSEYCLDPAFDQGIFKLKHDEYAKRYQKLSQDQQGEIAEILNDRISNQI